MSNNSIAKILDKVKFLDKVKILPGGISSTPTYSLQRSVAPIEGGGSSITFTVNTTNVADGTVLPYTISNISPADVTSGSLTGSFSVTNNTASTTLGVSLEPTSPGVGSASLALDNGAASISVFPAPTYSLSRSASSVDEGSSITFTLTTTGVANGTSVPYTISGISEGDLSSGSLSGNFVVNNGSAMVTVTLASDALTDGSETISITAAGQSSSATVNDTSVTSNPSLTPTYTLSRSSASFNEGSSVTFTLTTTNVADGTNIPYSVTGISAGDLSSGSLTGNFVVNNGSAALTLTATNDLLSEGYETITITAASQTSTSTINDTSVTIPTYVTTFTSHAKAIGFPIYNDNGQTSSKFYAIDNVNKLYTSDDLGSTWTFSRQMLSSSTGAFNQLYHRMGKVTVSPDQNTIISNAVFGVTTNGGLTWNDSNLTQYLRQDANVRESVDANFTYALNTTLNSAGATKIQRYVPGLQRGAGSRTDVGPSLAQRTGIAISGNGDLAYFSTKTELYKSTDRGINWTKIQNKGFDDIWCSHDGNRLFAKEVLNFAKLSKSEDGGLTWSDVSPYLTIPNLSSYNTWFGWGFDSDGSTILLGRGHTTGDPNPRSLFLSVNAGTTWTLLPSAYPPGRKSGSTPLDDNTLNIAINHDGTKFAINTNSQGRLFVSEDLGATWTQKYFPPNS